MVTNGFFLVAEGPGFLVVDKDPGLDFHDCDGRPGLCTLVGRHLGQPVFPVHRLDKATSGLLLLATDRSRAAALATLFRERLVEKYYVALSDSPPRKKQGLVQGDMVRSRRGTWKLARTMERPARTRFLSWSAGPGLRLFVLKPMTGRTHQLRVAMKSLVPHPGRRALPSPRAGLAGPHVSARPHPALLSRRDRVQPCVGSSCREDVSGGRFPAGS